MQSPERQPLDEALRAVGDRWSLLVVQALLEGPRRWSDLERAVPGIAPNVLADRLRRLEGDGVVASYAYSTRPLRRSYELTDTGRALAVPIRFLEDWGAGQSPAGPRHVVCGTPMEARWHCSTCDETVDEVGDDQWVL